MSVFSRRVGKRIKRDRDAKDWTQMDLANALADHGGPRYPSRISGWEHGALPTEENRLLLAAVLEQPPDRYFAWSQPDDNDEDQDESDSRAA